MFAILPLSAEAVGDLRRNAGVYMTGNARINIAGLNDTNHEKFVEALRPYLKSW